MSIIKLILILNNLATIPVVIFIIRSAICTRWDIQRTRSRNDKFKFYGLGIGLCLLVTLIAVLIPQISILLDLFGSIFGGLI